MRKLQIFVITNICKPVFVPFGRIGTWMHSYFGKNNIKKLKKVACKEGTIEGDLYQLTFYNQVFEK
jgi:hypothetical protein